MKPWIPSLATHYQQTTTSLATFWRVTRRDAAVFGWVDHDRDLVLDGVTYRASAGLAATATQTTSTLVPGTLDVSAFLDVSAEQEIDQGLWDEAAVLIFETRWDVPPTVVDATTCNILLTGTLGAIDRRTGRFQAALHGTLEALDTHIGRVFAPTCLWRLGDSRCTVDLTPFTHTGRVTSLGDDARYRFLDAASPQPVLYYDEGVITMTSGPNVGRAMDVRRWVDHTFHLHRPFPVPVTVGDTYTAVRGDDKRFATCTGVFHNARHFGGFPHIPGADAVFDNPLLRPSVPRPEEE